MLKVGLTYDLRQEYLAQGYSDEETAELDREDTIDALAQAIATAGHQVVRIGHAKALVDRLARGERWDLVFNIAEGLHGAARESQVPAILDVFQIPYTFSDPLVLGVALHKGLAKHVARAAGVPTPDFAVIETLEDLDAVSMPYPLFAKPIAEGTSKGVNASSLIHDRGALEDVTKDLLDRFRQPVLVETFLSGREFTVGIVGTGKNAEALGTLEVFLPEAPGSGIYSYDNKKFWEGRVSYGLARAQEDEEVRWAQEVAVAAWRALGCRDAGRVDVRSDAGGRPSFIEVNPLAGLNPEISDLAILIREVGLSYQDLIDRILDSAQQRVRREVNKPCTSR